MRLARGDSMAGNGNDLLDRLMEQLRRASILRRNVEGTCITVSTEMLVEIEERARAINPAEQGEQMITGFLQDVIEGKITPYN